MQYFLHLPKQEKIFKCEPNENGMRYLGFERILLSSSQEYSSESKDFEIFLVILSGRCDVSVKDREFKNIGGRKNVFQGKPFSVYIPPKSSFTIRTNQQEGVEVALAKAKVDEECLIEPYLIKPEEVASGKWGISNYSRVYHQIAVDQTHPAVKLMIGETFTPSGNWSTYPPHRHENDNLPEESYLEEIYFYKTDHPKGFGLARHYTDSRDMNACYVVEDNTLHLMPKGYHTVVAAPGFTVYYLWFLAGPKRVQAPYVDPDLRFVDLATNMIRNIENNLSV
ncbi:5-deoxy-glucuronate isomerase [Thermotoga profunda]|uniref:5-deoxy-glucuronate isomerase n=1 Tax=Thermotoga profunda TaxID=1508420 RepID=UPI000693E41F|nr:5-deoxy-glucuronate isomerase [Thermotoga profunda]